VLAGLVAAPPLASQAWRELGPAPISGVEFTGRAAAIATSAKRANRYYAGAASGGVWESTNGGRSWTARGDELPILSIGALAVDPDDDRILYAGSGEANGAYHSLYGLGLYKSTDRGRTWQVLGADLFAGRAFSRIVVSPHDSNDVWVAVARAGGTFGTVEGARGHPKRKGAVGVFRSRDGGLTWDRVRGGLRNVMASDVQLDPVDPDRIWVAHGDPFGRNPNGIYLSTDGGRRFAKAGLEINPQLLGRIMLAIAPSDPDRVYALIMNRTNRDKPYGFSPGGASTLAIIRSDDGGDTATTFFPGNFQGGQGNYNAAIVVHPTDPDVFFVGGVQMLRSTDGGETYADVTPPHVDVHGLVFDARGRLVAATDGGIYVSPDLGDTWFARNDGLGTVQFYAGASLHPSDATFLLAGTQDNGTNLRVGAGPRAWRHVFGGDGGYTAVDQADPDVFFVEFQGTGNLFRTTDGGATFNQSANGIDPNDRNCFLPPLVVDPGDPRRLLYATQRIYESTDGGLTWRPISGDLTGGPPFSVRSLVIAPSNPNLVHALTNDGRLLTSRDRGATWSLGLQGLGGWPRVTRQIAVDPRNHAFAYVADMRFGGGKVWQTKNAGRSWQSIGEGLPDVPVNTVGVHRAGSRRFILAGTDAGVFLSRNGGATWETYGDGLPNVPVQDLIVDPDHQRVVVTTLGRGVWWTALPKAAADAPTTLPLKAAGR